tara:strand:- start:114 stop:290 length:177 start_codon:yes stop_codon:yes gene_type:complete
MIPKMKIKEREREEERVEKVNRHRNLGHLQTEKVTNLKKTKKKYLKRKVHPLLLSLPF